MSKILCSLVLVLGMCGPAFALDLTSMAVGMLLADDGKPQQAPQTLVSLKSVADGFLDVTWNFSKSTGKVEETVREPKRVTTAYTFEEWVAKVRPDCEYVGFANHDGRVLLLIKKR